MASEKRWGLICGLAVISLIVIVGCFFGGMGRIVHAVNTDDVATDGTATAVYQAENSPERFAIQDEENAQTDSEQEIMMLVGKYVCNAMVALIAAMLINYVVMMLSSQTRRTSDSELLEHTMSYYESNDPDAKYVSSMETYRTNWFVEIMKGLMVNPFERWK